MMSITKPENLFSDVSEGDKISVEGREEPLTVYRHVTEDDIPGQAITMKRVTEDMAEHTAWEVENGRHANDVLEVGDLMTGEHTGDEFLIARGPRGGCYLLKQWWNKTPLGEWAAEIALYRCTMSDTEVWTWENTVNVEVVGSEDVDRDAFDEGGDWVHVSDVDGATVWTNALDGDVWEHSEALTGAEPAEPSEDPREDAMDELETVSEGDTVQVNELDAMTVTDVADRYDGPLADGVSIMLDDDAARVRTFPGEGKAVVMVGGPDGEDVTDVTVE